MLDGESQRYHSRIEISIRLEELRVMKRERVVDGDTKPADIWLTIA